MGAFEVYSIVEVLESYGVYGWRRGDLGIVLETPNEHNDHYTVRIPRIGNEGWGFHGHMLRVVETAPNTALRVFTPAHIATAREDKIKAIKVVRDLTGIGLKEAKDLTEAIIESGRKFESPFTASNSATIAQLEKEVSDLRNKLRKALESLPKDALIDMIV